MVAARELYGRVTAPVTLVFGDHDWSRVPEREATLRCFRERNRSRLTTPDTSPLWNSPRASLRSSSPTSAPDLATNAPFPHRRAARKDALAATDHHVTGWSFVTVAERSAILSSSKRHSTNPRNSMVFPRSPFHRHTLRQTTLSPSATCLRSSP
jgi:hypothetical protein